jgi:uncharacterized protein involved in exopolysaccharide biosynthesis
MNALPDLYVNQPHFTGDKGWLFSPRRSSTNTGVPSTAETSREIIRIGVDDAERIMRSASKIEAVWGNPALDQLGDKVKVKEAEKLTEENKDNEGFNGRAASEDSLKLLKNEYPEILSVFEEGEKTNFQNVTPEALKDVQKFLLGRMSCRRPSYESKG